ncbi:U4/U6 small nuclear ribonucleoprotein Prp3-like [Pyrus ussuriensis x Pyrus communis]|uniref:U4/U6 small nuclear ribonucleoprotein Prp3-like n=1 Tax=Pyrus ussuriensis x Pyrus communis TaxID=2448454 RepID=A0A5N5GKH8_9ROSA|nr:U4/U6 small nuclear ribonucleoprotein Prp3-like [Pyrus ussuriensis x Pyrus communis]
MCTATKLRSIPIQPTPLCDVEERITGAMYALCSGPRFHSEKVFVLVSLAGWGAVVYKGYKLFTKGKEDKKEKVEREIYGRKERSTNAVPQLKVNINKQKKEAFQILKPELDVDPEKNPHFDPDVGMSKKIFGPKRMENGQEMLSF